MTRGPRLRDWPRPVTNTSHEVRATSWYMVAAPRSLESGMRRLPLIAILSAGLAGTAHVATGCSGDGSCPEPDPSAKPTDAAADAIEPLDAAARADAGGPTRPFSLDATAPVTSIRIANWSADAPAVDFCVAPHGTSNFQGPLLSAGARALEEAGLDDAGGTQLGFPLVSAYLPIPPGHYDARLVAAGSTDCSARIIPDTTNLPTLRAGGTATFALVGATQPQGSEPALEIVGFIDDVDVPSGVAMRVINASADLPSVDFGVGKVFQPPFLDIPFGAASEGPDASTLEASTEASTQEASTPDASLDGAVADASPPPPMTDPNGYYSPETLSGATLTARASGSPTAAAVATNISVAPGVDLTIAVLGLGQSLVDASASAQLLECVDNGGTVGLLANCSIISQ
jgi:Domain of unknown function (DUF4397)